MPELPLAMPEILPPAPPEEPRAEDEVSVPRQRHRPNVVALSLAAIGFGVAVSAQYMNWAYVVTVSLPAGGADLGDTTAAAHGVDIPLGYLSVAHVMSYLLTLGLALSAVAVSLSATGLVHRVAIGAAAGLLGANLLVLVGIKGVIDHAAFGLGGLESTDAKVSPAAGYYLAYAAILALAAALVLAARVPAGGGPALRLRRRQDGEAEGGEPLELTVTPVPPSFQ